MWAAAIFAQVYDGISSPPMIAMELALFVMLIGATATVLVASVLTVILILESRHQKRSGGELPPRRQRLAQAVKDPSAQRPPTRPNNSVRAITVSNAPPRLHEAAFPRPQLPGSRPPHRWRPRGRRYAIGYPAIDRAGTP